MEILSSQSVFRGQTQIAVILTSCGRLLFITHLTTIYHYGAFLNDDTRQLGGSLYSCVVEFVIDKNAFDKKVLIGYIRLS